MDESGDEKTKQDTARKKGKEKKEEVYPDPNSRDEKTWLVNLQPERRKFRCEDKRLSLRCVSLILTPRLYMMFEASLLFFICDSFTVRHGI